MKQPKESGVDVRRGCSAWMFGVETGLLRLAFELPGCMTRK
jgi:hypothetical protein